MRKPFILLTSLFAAMAVSATAVAAPLAGTNDFNREAGLPHVNVLATTTDSVTLEFNNAMAYELALFQLRFDRAQEGTHAPTTVCVDTRTDPLCGAGPVIHRVLADDVVEVQLYLGEEHPANFTWTSFEADPEPEPVAVVAEPAMTKDDCKRGGWEALGFRNQGQCVRYVNTGKDSRDA